MAPSTHRTRRSKRKSGTEVGAGESFCLTCGGTSAQNREGEPEATVHCSKCNSGEHPSCLPLTDKAREAIRTYEWRCNECKECMTCGNTKVDSLLVTCSDCDRTCHISCASPRLFEVPSGPWKCGLCKGKRVPGRKPVHQAAVPCPHPGCNSEGNTDGVSATHSTLTACPMHLVATPVAEPKRSARNVRPAEVTPGSPPRKRARIAPTPVEAATPARTPRVKLVLGGSSHKKKVAPTPVVVEEGPPDPRTLPFGGRLTDEDADTTTCKPAAVDRALFKRARVQAEKIIASSLANSSNSSSSLDLVTSPTRTTEDHEHDTEFYAPAVPKIKSIYFGTREISTWYSAPYPEEYNGQPHIYICEYCFKYMKSEYVAGRHQAKCPLRHPPGDEIYRDGTVSVFEVDGRKNKIYCQNLCLLAKMFLDHKTLYYDVEPFLFYILTENDENGCHFVGYFSKEKRSSANYNLSCIVTLPVSQRKGYGGLLIEFSYLLSRKEGRTGSPEKPLSDLGLVTYRRYWRRTVLRALDGLEDDESVSIEQLSAKTCMTADDIIHTLHLMNMLQRNAQGDHVLVVPRRIVREQVEKARGNAPTGATVNPGLLRWTPLLFKPVMQQPPVVDAQERDEERDEGAVEVPEVGDGDGEAEAETVDV